MEKLNLKRELIFWLLLLAPCIYILTVWNILPERVAIHFGMDGQPNGWGGKGSTFIIPLVNLFTYLLLLGIPYIDPKKMNYEFFISNFYKIRLLLAVFMTAISLLIVQIAITGNSTLIGHWLPASVFLLLAFLGNFMINIKPNWFVGIRTPWTLSSDIVWKKTHQVGGRIFFYGGLLCFALSFFIKAEWTTALILVFALGSALFSAGYSFWLFKQQEKNPGL